MAEEKAVTAIIHDFHHALEPRYHAIVTGTSPEVHAEQFEGFTHEQLSGLAAYIFLPKDDGERSRLLNAYETDPGSFPDDIDRTALANYVKHGAEIRMRYGLDWRNCLKDADRAHELPMATVAVLDKVALYLQMPAGDDHTRFNLLLRNALHMKLISADAFADVHDDIFSYLKPPPTGDLTLFQHEMEGQMKNPVKAAKPAKPAKTPKAPSKKTTEKPEPAKAPEEPSPEQKKEDLLKKLSSLSKF